MSQDEKEFQKLATQVARSLISEETYNSDPIYAKIDQWFEEGVPEEKIRERVRRYMEKKEEKDDD